MKLSDLNSYGAFALLSVEERELLSAIPEKERPALLERLARGEPGAYVFGKKYFFENYFCVNEACLIPRPDTERIVEAVLSLLPESSPAAFADLCTGCGCIALSVLYRRRSARAVAVDISERALSAARDNAGALSLSDRISLITSDILKTNPLGGSVFPLIVANPPYLAAAELEEYPLLASEPRAAFDGGEDGLVFYRRMLAAFSENLSSSGSFVFEIGYAQGASICALAGAYGFSCTVAKDYGGNDRVAVLKRRKFNN